MEVAAEQKRAAKALQLAEAEAAEIEKARTVYKNIWAQFADDSKNKGRSAAYIGLKDNLAIGADYLVPHMMTAKEHMAVIADCDKNIAGDSGIPGEDIREVVERWLRGDIELSRIPLEAPTLQPVQVEEDE